MPSSVSRLGSAAACLLMAATLGACATRRYVDNHVAVVDAKLDATASETHTRLTGLEDHVGRADAHFAELDRSTREALDRAQTAGRLAEGKFVYAMVLSDDSVKFPVAGVALSKEAQARLDDLVRKLRTDNRNVYLEIQGYTDASGDKGANYRLGEARAEAVRRYLNEAGVALNRMATISYGAEQPVAANGTAQGRAQNRRVVLVVMA